jgi:hypothetical protein
MKAVLLFNSVQSSIVIKIYSNEYTVGPTEQDRSNI